MSLNAVDRLALTDLVHLYASAVDDRRFDDVIELFTETAELRLPDPPRSLEPVRRHHGRDGVREAMACGGRSRPERSTRSSVRCTRLPTTPTMRWAASRASPTTGPVADGQVTDLVWHLRYDDEYLRTRCRMAHPRPRADHQRYRDPPGSPPSRAAVSRSSSGR